jgi:hypothetical protein
MVYLLFFIEVLLHCLLFSFSLTSSSIDQLSPILQDDLAGFPEASAVMHKNRKRQETVQ